MRDEYAFSPEELRKGTRGPFATRLKAGVNLVSIDPDVAQILPDAGAMNQAPDAMAAVVRARHAEDEPA